MAGTLLGDPSHHGTVENSPYLFSHDRVEEADHTGSTWYLSRREIEENSPSRRDGIDLKKEAYFRKSYCTFLQDLGMRLKVHPVTIATAIVFCHRFFLRQSHAKNDWRTIATVCMFLAGKVEESPRPLKDVILISYEIINKKDPAAIQRIKPREVYEQQKELILLGERVVLATLGFDFNVNHPYKPLVEAIKKFKVAQNDLAKVAWNFVNDGLRTSLCLQFKPHHIAAGAIFLAAKFLKVKLPSDGEKVWWQEFDVTPRQLEEVSNQMLELYEQNRVGQSSHRNETDGSSAGGASHRTAPIKAPAAPEEPSLQNVYVPAAGTSGVQHAAQTNSKTHAIRGQSHLGKPNGTQRTVQNVSINHASKEPRSGYVGKKMEDGHKDLWHHELGNLPEASTSLSYHGSEHPVEELGMSVQGGAVEAKDSSVQIEGTKCHSPIDAIKRFDKDKVKAALEKRRKSRAELARKVDIIDEDDLIERELESGIELASGDEKMKQERRQSWSKPFRHEPQNSNHRTENGIGGTEVGNTEEGDLALGSREFHSPEPTCTKRKAVSPDQQLGINDGYDMPHYNAPLSKHRDNLDDTCPGRLERKERDHKRHRQENQV